MKKRHPRIFSMLVTLGALSLVSVACPDASPMQKGIDCDSSSVLTEQDCSSEEPEAHVGDHDVDNPPGGSTEGTIEGSTTADLDAGASEGASDGNGNGGSATSDAGAMDGSGNTDGTSDGNTDGAQTTDAGGLDGVGDGQTEGAALLDAGQQDGASDGATDGQSDGASDNIVNIDCGVDAGLPEDLGREIIVLAQKQEALDTLDAGVTNNVATLIDGPTDVVVYGDYVYWTNFGGDTVMRILKTGGAPEIVASGQSTPDGLAIDETGVYWTNYENFTAGSVNRLAHGSATVETLVDGLSGPRAAALNSTHVYWVAPFYGMILRVTKNGGDVELIHSGQGNVVDIVATEDTIYWSTWENNSAGGVFASALEGGPIETIATGQNGVYRLVLDENTLYWSGYDSKTISKKEIGGTNTEVITNTTTAPWGIATDASHVYWVQSGDKTIRKTHKDGCEEKILASGLEGSLLNLTVDDTHVYWTNGSGGQQILKMLK